MLLSDKTSDVRTVNLIIKFFFIAFLMFVASCSPNPEEYVEIFEKVKTYDPFILKLDKSKAKKVSGRGIVYISTKSGSVYAVFHDSEGQRHEISEWYDGVYSMPNQLSINKEVFDEYPPEDLNEIDFVVFMKISFKPVYVGRGSTFFIIDEGIKMACDSKIEGAIVDLKSKTIVAEKTFIEEFSGRVQHDGDRYQYKGYMFDYHIRHWLKTIHIKN